MAQEISTFCKTFHQARQFAPLYNMLPFRLRQGYLGQYLILVNILSPCGLESVTSSLCASVSLFLKRRIWSICIKDLLVSSVQSLSHVRLFETPWTVAHQASLSITNSWSMLRLTFIESTDAIQPSHPLSSPSPPAFSLSQHQGLFQCVSSLHQVAKVLELQPQYQSLQ